MSVDGWGYKFLCKQGWHGLNRKWIRYSDICPYHIGHYVKMHQPECVKDSLFNLYCSNHRKAKCYPPERGGNSYRHGKLYKLYWFLHPQYR